MERSWLLLDCLWGRRPGPRVSLSSAHHLASDWWYWVRQFALDCLGWFLFDVERPLFFAFARAIFSIFLIFLVRISFLSWLCPRILWRPNQCVSNYSTLCSAFGAWQYAGGHLDQFWSFCICCGCYAIWCTLLLRGPFAFAGALAPSLARRISPCISATQ